jgi:hypothetical protein
MGIVNYTQLCCKTCSVLYMYLSLQRVLTGIKDTIVKLILTIVLRPLATMPQDV